MSRKTEVGDLVLIPFNDVEWACACVIYVSTFAKSAIRIGVLPDRIRDVKTFNAPSEVNSNEFILDSFTATASIKKNIWRYVGQVETLNLDFDPSLFIYADDLSCNDHVVRPVTTPDYKKFPHFCCEGMIYVSNKIAAKMKEIHGDTTEE